MLEILLGGVFSIIGVVIGILIGIYLPRYLKKSDLINEQKKWSEFFYYQLLDISSKVKYPLNRDDAVKPLILEYSTNPYPQIRDWEDSMIPLFSYNF